MNARRLLLALMMTASSAHVGSTAIELLHTVTIKVHY